LPHEGKEFPFTEKEKAAVLRDNDAAAVSSAAGQEIQDRLRNGGVTLTCGREWRKGKKAKETRDGY